MIRDVLKNVERKEFIERFVSEHFSNFNPSSLNENLSMKDLKEKILNLLGSISDFGILNDILNRLYKESFQDSLDEIARIKELDSKTMEEFGNFFFQTSGLLEDKKQFLELIKTSGIWSESGILGATTITSTTSKSILLSNSEFISNMTEKLKSWKAPLGAKSGVGAGEGIFVFYVKGAGKASKGDISIGGKMIEVKANSGKNGTSGGRLLGTTADWIKPPAIRKEMFQILSTKNNMLVKSGKNDYAFISSQLSNWNEILRGDKKESVKILKDIISLMYVKSNTDMSWIEKAVENDGTITNSFLEEFAVFQFKYYQKIEGFQAVLFISNSSDKLVICYDEKDYRKLVKNGNINFGGFDWNQERNLAYQVGLK